MYVPYAWQGGTLSKKILLLSDHGLTFKPTNPNRRSDQITVAAKTTSARSSRRNHTTRISGQESTVAKPSLIRNPG